MFIPLSVALAASLVGVAAYGLVLVGRNRPIDNPMFFLLVGAEVVTLLTLIGGVLSWGGAAPGMSKAVFVAYLLGMLLALPAATAWSLVDRETRWGTGVLVIAALGLLVMTVRLIQLWNGHA